MFYFYRKRQGKIVKSLVSLHVVLIVADVFAAADPASVVAICVYFRVEKWFHTVVIEGIWFQQVYDVKSVGFASTSVIDSEIKPLHVVFGVAVRF